MLYLYRCLCKLNMLAEANMDNLHTRLVLFLSTSCLASGHRPHFSLGRCCVHFASLDSCHYNATYSKALGKTPTVTARNPTPTLKVSSFVLRPSAHARLTGVFDFRRLMVVAECKRLLLTSDRVRPGYYLKITPRKQTAVSGI